MKKRIITAIVLTLLLSLPALAITAEEAQTAAHAYVPSDAVYQKTETDDGLFEVKYLSADGREEYDVRIDRNSGRIVQIEWDLLGGRGGRETALTEDEARAIALERHPGAEILALRSERDDGLYEYRILLSTDEFFAAIELNAETGAVLEEDLYYNDAVPEGLLNYGEAILKLETLKPGANVLRIEFDEDDGLALYEGEAILDGAIHEFELAADSGDLLEWERDD